MQKSPSSEAFSKKVSQLQETIERHTAQVASKEKCIPTILIAAVALPFLILATLFFLQPSFVQRKDGNKYVRDGSKVFYWSVIITIVLWIGLYLYTWCSGYVASMICAKT